MAINIEIEQLSIEAPAGWDGRADRFRRSLEAALATELASLEPAALDEHEALRVDLPPLTGADIYDLDETARAIARRIAQALGRPPA